MLKQKLSLNYVVLLFAIFKKVYFSLKYFSQKKKFPNMFLILVYLTINFV